VTPSPQTHLGTFLIFQVDGDRYAIAIGEVLEVLPLLNLKKIPHAADGIAGVFNWHGTPAPAVDLSAMMAGKPARERLSTRIVLVRHKSGNGDLRPLGLLAEMATETVRFDTRQFQEPGVTATGAPYLGPTIDDGRGIVQWIKPGDLLTPAVREQLWQQAAANLF